MELAKCLVAAAQREELGCRSYQRASQEAGRSRSSPDKWLLKEEVAAERRGASAKRLLSEEVAHKGK